MRVGIDARLLSEQITGIGRYTLELTRELIQCPSEFYLYSGGTVDCSHWQQRNVTVRTANAGNRASRMIWSQTSLPKWSAEDKIDLFWGATHRLPRLLPKSVARVVTIHDLVWKHAGETMRPLSRLTERLLMPQAIKLSDRIVADSQSTAHAIEAEYPQAADKVRVVYPGATTFPKASEFSLLSKLGVSRNYFLFVGTLEPRKNLDRLLKACALMNLPSQGNYQLVIVGGKGWGGVQAESLVANYGLNKNVLKLGYVSESELATLYAHARFLVMPSFYEGFGLPIVEAMSFGVPVLTSNTSSMPEVAGDAAILVDPAAVNSIADGLLALMNPVQRDLLASNAKKNAARFTWEKAAKELWSVFEEACEVRRCRL